MEQEAAQSRSPCPFIFPRLSNEVETFNFKSKVWWKPTTSINPPCEGEGEVQRQRTLIITPGKERHEVIQFEAVGGGPKKGTKKKV